MFVAIWSSTELKKYNQDISNIHIYVVNWSSSFLIYIYEKMFLDNVRKQSHKTRRLADGFNSLWQSGLTAKRDQMT